MPPPKVAVRLTPDDRSALARLVRAGRHPARTLTRARILLKADAGGPDRWPDDRIADALGVSRATVARVRHRFAAGGLDPALYPRPAGPRPRKLDGGQEARLVALACAAPPDGHARWTMALLAGRLVELAVVGSVHPATVWRALKKTTSSRGSGSSG